MDSKQNKQRRREERRKNRERVLRNFRRSLTRTWQGFTGFLKNISLGLLMLIGVGMVAAAILLANTLAEQSTAVLVAGIGSILGTAVFAFTLPAVIRTKSKEAVYQTERQIEDKVALTDEIKTLRKIEEDQLEEILILEKEKGMLQAELTKQKSMHIEIDHIQPVERVSFLEVRSMITDVLLKELDSSPPDGVRKGVEQEFLGVLDAHFKANLGVDMKKVGLRINDTGQIVVSGIRSEFQGFFVENEDWKLYEIREKRWGGILGQTPSKRVLHRDERLAELTIEQRSSLIDRLSMGVDLSYLDESIRKLTMEYLTMLLSPLNREIIFIENEPQPTMQLGDFLGMHNAQVDEQVSKLRTRLTEVEKRLLEEGDELSTD